MNRPIGVIDSGVGGLTVAKEMMRQLPKETIYYVGDTARCPYGPRLPGEVRKFTWEMTRFLERYDMKMLVIACNTATAAVLEEIRREMPVPVVGVIQPGARAAIKQTKNRHIAVLGTVGTIKSGAYERAIKATDSTAEIYPLACPDFVPLVESGEYKSERANDIVAATLKPLKETPADTVILGCTHYPLLEPMIAEFMGPDVAVISSGDETARGVSAILEFNEMLAEDEKPEHRFFTTGDTKTFYSIASDWLGDTSIQIKTIQLA
ncbi:glutamate racemase [Domibacillus antri]|uniref:Glutamate racemase n=1 Tax=Domibacillus antri TaxID=1714264 RepID=A0A1Q8Q5H6_9BACI|nr:glutamate racemase [Domibacillus antri]OLN22613.1 glutamate racemase [Domibacillus antri]